MLVVFHKTKEVFSGHGLYKIYPLRVMIDATIGFLKKVDMPIDVQGHKMFLDAKDSLCLSINNGMFEPVETTLVKKHVKRKNVVVDIGANIGYYTLMLARLVGDEGRVFAFEPDPENFLLLKKNVEANGYDHNVILVQKAVSDVTGTARLYQSETNKGDHRMHRASGDRRAVSIETVSLDDYFEDYDGEIDFVKMDIQGSEGHALQGMQNLLKNNKVTNMLTEFCPAWIERTGVSSGDMLSSIERHGFTFFDISQASSEDKGRSSSQELLTAYPPVDEEKDQTNLWCVRTVFLEN